MPRPREGTAYRPKNAPHGPWWIRIVLSDGFRPAAWPVPGSEKWSPAKAKEYARAKTQEAQRDKLVRPPKATAGSAVPPTTMADLAERWRPIVASSDLKSSSKLMHETNLRRIERDFGTKTPDEIDPAALAAWLRETSKGLSASRVQNVWTTLGQLFDAAIGEKWWKGQNPCRSTYARRYLPAVEVKGDDAKARHTEAEASKLLSSPALPRERFMRYLLAYTAGLIDGELAGLRWSSVATIHGVPVLRVSSSIDARFGRGEPKTEARKDTVPLHPLTEHALNWWREHGWKAYVGREPQPHDPILPDEKGEPWRFMAMASLFRDDLEAAGLPTSWLSPDVPADEQDAEPFQLRSTRRSFATWLGGHDIDGATKDRLLRHKGRSVRERHYEAETAPVMRRLAAAVARITLDVPTLVPSGESSGGSQVPENASGDKQSHSGSPQQSASQRPGNVSQAEDAYATGASKSAETRDRTERADASIDPVEAALAEALTRASAAGEWSVVAQLARELEARRTSHAASNVVALASRRGAR